MQRLRSSISIPWLVASVVIVLAIWCNSMVPGSDSSEISHGVLAMVQGFLVDLGLPASWVSNFIIRKMAHFTEYAALGVSVSAALDRHAHLDCVRVLSIVSTVLIAASLDEVIQLFVPGRCGQVADVLLDCMGAITGVAASSFVRRRIAKRSIS